MKIPVVRLTIAVSTIIYFVQNGFDVWQFSASVLILSISNILADAYSKAVG